MQLLAGIVPRIAHAAVRDLSRPRGHRETKVSSRSVSQGRVDVRALTAALVCHMAHEWHNRWLGRLSAQRSSARFGVDDTRARCMGPEPGPQFLDRIPAPQREDRQTYVLTTSGG